MYDVMVYETHHISFERVAHPWKTQLTSLCSLTLSSDVKSLYTTQQ